MKYSSCCEHEMKKHSESPVVLPVVKGAVSLDTDESQIQEIIRWQYFKNQDCKQQY